MRKNTNIRKKYIKYVLRPYYDIRHSFVYLYSRILLLLSIQGIKLPGIQKIKNKLPPNALSAYERKILVNEIKGKRYSIRTGPLLLRKILEKISFIFFQNRFWFFMTLKILIATLIIAIPIGLFIIIRGVLPVPERVPYESINTKLSESSRLRTDWPYTEGPFTKEINKSQENFNYIDPNNSRGISITPVSAPETPPGLIHFGIGYYPIKVNLMRGFLVGESSPTIIQRQKDITIEVEDGNKLRIQYYLFPSKDNSIYQCQLQIKDDQGNIIANTIQSTPKKYLKKTSNQIINAWDERFVPNSKLDSEYIGEFIINQKSLPKKLLASSYSLPPNNEILNVANQQSEDKKISNQFNFENINIKGNNVTNDNCIYALGDFSFERIVLKSPARRGVIFILVDTLRADTAYDANIMPNLNNYAKENAMKFLEHRAQGNMTVPSVLPLMTSRYSREIGPVAFEYAADTTLKRDFYSKNIPFLATSMQNLGYRVGGIGWLSLFSEGLQGGVDLGFHNAIISENSEYEARQITEQMGFWLEQYGDAPFFLYLHYNTMHGPYKPPLNTINFQKFLSKPFGLNQRQTFYNALGTYWDDEFKNILQKLKDLNIYDNVDLIVTADHGSQISEQPWNYFMGVNKDLQGGYTDKGHTLFDEEIRVPFIFHLANNNETKGMKVSTPTAHIDVFPTLYDLAGGKHTDKKWRGIDLYPAIKNEPSTTISELLKSRNSIYFEGHNYTGILYWGNEFIHNPMKYIRQLSPDKVMLLLGHNPWSSFIHWFQAEIFSSVNFQNHTEKWLPMLQNEKLKEIREVYFNTSPSEKRLRISPKYTGNFSCKITFYKDQVSNNIPSFISLPKTINFSDESNSSSYVYRLNGTVLKNEIITLELKNSKITNIEFQEDSTPIICPNGVAVKNENIASILNKNVCSYFPPHDEIVSENYLEKNKPIVIQNMLSMEESEEIEGKGAGELLKNALKDWGYAQ